MSLSSFRDWIPDASANAASLKRCFENMFWVTNIKAAARAQKMPTRLPLNSAEHASMTPNVRGMRDMYVATGYRISKIER